MRIIRNIAISIILSAIMVVWVLIFMLSDLIQQLDFGPSKIGITDYKVPGFFNPVWLPVYVGIVFIFYQLMKKDQ